MTIAEFFFDLVGEMSGTHHHAAYTLRSQLPDQQLKKRRTSNGSQRFGGSWQYRLQSRAYPAYELSGLQPVSLRILCVLPKIILSSEGRIKRGTGRISAFKPDNRIAVRKTSWI